MSGGLDGDVGGTRGERSPVGRAPGQRQRIRGTLGSARTVRTAKTARLLAVAVAGTTLIALPAAIFASSAGLAVTSGPSPRAAGVGAQSTATPWRSTTAATATADPGQNPVADPNQSVDGATPATAAASCWAIKQRDSAAADGRYWLVNPQLGYPRQFWCDMTTDGGGWVLIGRGRQGWAWRDRGQGSAAAVAGQPSGPAAFAVQYYSSATVDALLGGVAPDALDDPILVRRAATAMPTGPQDWQQIGYQLAPDTAPQWSWGFAAGLALTSMTVAGTRYTPADTSDTFPATGDDSHRVQIVADPQRSGFGYGRPKPGAPAVPSVPFAQVLVRPKLADAAAGGSAVPDRGLPEVVLPPILSSMSEPLSGWGVTGQDPTGAPAGTGGANVLALAQHGERIYVGGSFTGVRRGPTGTPVAQPYLAAFDRRTGAFLPDFRPLLDGAVWALAVTADGKLLAGGRFTKANAAARPALVALDPRTGATDPTWVATASLAAPAGGSPRSGAATAAPRAGVRALAVRDRWLYVAGSLTSVTGGTGLAARRVQVSGLARVEVATGRPDPDFHPALGGPVSGLATSVLGDRVYASGTAPVGSAPVGSASSLPSAVAVLDTQTPAVVDAEPRADARAPRGAEPAGATPSLRAVLESADGRRVFAAPADGTLHLLDRATMAELAAPVSAVPSRPGAALPAGAPVAGSGQAMVETAGVLYVTCRCLGWNRSGPAQRISSISGIGAYDSRTLTKLDDFEPFWKGRTDAGLWATLVDSAGCVWFGGDVVTASLNRWAGGFVKYCPRDAIAPSSPQSLRVGAGGGEAGGGAGGGGAGGGGKGSGGARLTWVGGADATGPVTFQVLRNDRVVASTATREWSDPWSPAPGATARYAVRAMDTAGNLSASTPVIPYPG